MTDAFARPLVGLLPVLSLLAALLYLDSYKLVKLRTVVAVLAYGAVLAAATYPLNDLFLDRFPMPLSTFSSYVAPASEELLKALVIVVLVRAHRVAFGQIDGCSSGSFSVVGCCPRQAAVSHTKSRMNTSPQRTTW